MKISQLSSRLLAEKNRTATDSAWLVLLEIQLPGSPIYIVHNNENIIWNNIEWLAFPFQIGDATVNDKETPSIGIKVSNITREVGAAVAARQGGGGTPVIIRVVNSACLDETAPVLEEIFQATKTEVNAQWVSITLSVPNDLIRRFPMKTALKNFCSYLATPASGYCGIECGLPPAVKAQYPACNGTLRDCRERGNAARFGGEPGLDATIYG